jgi:hypothetical protein
MDSLEMNCDVNEGKLSENYLALKNLIIKEES